VNKTSEVVKEAPFWGKILGYTQSLRIVLSLLSDPTPKAASEVSGPPPVRLLRTPPSIDPGSGKPAGQYRLHTHLLGIIHYLRTMLLMREIEARRGILVIDFAQAIFQGA